MKTYLYNELDHENNPIEITEQEILDKYWDYWSKRGMQKFGRDSPKITKENCIDDWIVIHWAWEKK